MRPLVSQKAEKASVPRIRYQGQRIPDHAPRLTAHCPEARAPVSMAGLGRWRVWWHGSEDEVPEIGAWAGFGSKTPHLKHFLPDFSDEETDHHPLPDPLRAG